MGSSDHFQPGNRLEQNSRCNLLQDSKMPTKRSPRGLKRKIKEEKENLDQVDIKNETDEFDGESDDDLAEYEQRRLQNILDRKNKIDELKITDISLELAAVYSEREEIPRLPLEDLSLE